MKKDLSALSASDLAVVIGWNLGKKSEKEAFSWLYSKHPKLKNCSPKDYLDTQNNPQKLIEIYTEDFGEDLEIPDFKTEK